MSVLSCVGKPTCSPGESFFESSHSESVQEMYRRLLGFFAETRESVAQSKAIKTMVFTDLNQQKVVQQVPQFL